MTYKWTTWLKHQERHMLLCARALGIQDIDIRRIRYAWNYDMVEVETWNRRRLLVSGIDMFSSAQLIKMSATVRTEESAATRAWKGVVQGRHS